MIAVVAEHRGRLLLFRRPEDAALLAGLWELPTVSCDSDQRPQDVLAAKYGGAWRVGSAHGTVRHNVTHRAYTVEVRDGRLEDGGAVAEGREAGWFLPREVETLAASALVDKVLRCRADGKSGSQAG